MAAQESGAGAATPHVDTPAEADRRELLLLSLLTLFVGFFVAAELLGAKLFHFTLFGVGPSDLGIGEGGEFIATTGILAFPLTFLLTDVIHEYFGKRIVRRFTFLALAVNVALQPVVQVAIRVPARSFAPGIDDATVQSAYQLALGQSWSIVAASMLAFLIGQWLDAQVFTWMRRRTGGKWLWLRAQGSTVISQWVDSVVVIYVAFVVLPMLSGGSPMASMTALGIAATNYVYKFLIAILSTPLLYLAHALIRRWLGRPLAERLAREAHPADPA